MFSELDKLQQKLQQNQSLIQKQQLKIKSLTTAAANSPGEASGAEASATQGWLSVEISKEMPGTLTVTEPLPYFGNNCSNIWQRTFL